MIRLDLLNVDKRNNSNGDKNTNIQQTSHDNKNENLKSHSTYEEFHDQNVFEFIPSVFDNISSIHLQSDFANLKNIETEIQLALNSLKQVNSQNLTDFIM